MFLTLKERIQNGRRILLFMKGLISIEYFQVADKELFAKICRMRRKFWVHLLQTKNLIVVWHLRIEDTSEDSIIIISKWVKINNYFFKVAD